MDGEGCIAQIRGCVDSRGRLSLQKYKQKPFAYFSTLAKSAEVCYTYIRRFAGNTHSARNIITNGKYVAQKNAYAMFIEGKKAAFVGVGHGNTLVKLEVWIFLIGNEK